MSTNIRTHYILLILLSLFTCFLSCKKDNNIIYPITLTDNQIILPADSDTTVVTIETSGPWRIKHAPSDWFKTDILGGTATQKTFRIIHQKNERDNIRNANILIYPENGSKVDTITIIQLSRHPFINLQSNNLEINSTKNSYSITFETNIPELDIDMSTNFPNQVSPWIESIIVADKTISFDIQSNTLPEERSANIILKYIDEYNRLVEEIITITQASYADIDNAELTSIQAIKSLAVGTINENKFIRGHIVSNGSSSNYLQNRYIIQDENNNAICFESQSSLIFNEFDKVDLWLKDVQIVKGNEGNFSYNIIRNVTATHIISSQQSSFSPSELSISELKENHLFALVTLKNVEISSPHGAFTNFKKSITPGNPSPNFMQQFPSYYLFYPTSIRDVNGNNMYMLTNPTANFATEILPQGSGKITGLVVKEKLTNFDIKESQISIRPLKRENINLQSSRNNSFTNILVEWNCSLTDLPPAGTHQLTNSPSIGNTNSILTTNNTPGFARNRINQFTIVPIDEYRGNLSNDGRTGGAYNAVFTALTHYWYIDNVSTIGINTQLSLQLEANSGWSGGPTDMLIEYAFDKESTVWTKVPNSDFKCLGQFDRTAAAGQTPNNIPGYKVYDFKLPNELNNKPNICLRIKPSTTSGTNNTTSLGSTHRLANLSIKYNK